MNFGYSLATDRSIFPERFVFKSRRVVRWCGENLEDEEGEMEARAYICRFVVKPNNDK